MSVLTENWHTRYIKDADSDSFSGISYLNFQPYIHFWANLTENVTGVLAENWHTHTHTDTQTQTHTHIHTEFLQDVDCYFDISFLKFET